MKQEVKLIYADNKKPYLTVKDYQFDLHDKKLEGLMLFKINNRWTEAYFDEMLGPEIQEVRQVIALPEHIGLIEGSTPPKDGGIYSAYYSDITSKELKEIKSSGGNCFIDLERICKPGCPKLVLNGERSTCCGDSITQPLFISCKIIISYEKGR